MYLDAQMRLTLTVNPGPAVQRVTSQTIDKTFNHFGKHGIA